MQEIKCNYQHRKPRFGGYARNWRENHGVEDSSIVYKNRWGSEKITMNQQVSIANWKGIKDAHWYVIAVTRKMQEYRIISPIKETTKFSSWIKRIWWNKEVNWIKLIDNFWMLWFEISLESAEKWTALWEKDWVVIIPKWQLIFNF